LIGDCADKHARVVRDAVLLMLLIPMASAAITWERQEVEPVARLEDTVIRADFPFVVTGSPVTIGEMRSDCPCLVAEVDKREYRPGERGVVRLVFSVGDRQGTYDRHVLVQTTAAGDHRLEFRVKLPLAYTLSQALVKWDAGEDGASKRVRLEVHGGHRLTSVVAEPSHPAVSVHVEEMEKGRLYDLVVRVAITTDHPLPARRSLTLLVALP
jgi:hypothetical protein